MTRSLMVFFSLTLVSNFAVGQLLPENATVSRLATGFSFTEGPVFDNNGGILFTDISRSDIVRYDIAQGTTEIVDGNSGGANGLYFNADGNLISMDGQRRQVSKRQVDDMRVVESVLADEWNSLRFNNPNDLVIASDGGIYFTDPDYGNRNSQPEAAYYINPAGELSQIISGFRRPNGIMLSPNEDTLYLAVEAETRIMAYDIGDDGLPTNEREFALTNTDSNGVVVPSISNGPDGMTVDAAGNLYAAVQDAVWAWSPSGERLFELDVPENPTNVVFGGDGSTLYITARTSLYSVELNTVPEPSSGFLLATGVICLLRIRKQTV